MTNHPKRHRLRAVSALTLFLATVAMSASDVLPGTVGRVLLTATVIALGVRALWWVGVDGRRPDMARIMSDRADARQVRR